MTDKELIEEILDSVFTFGTTDSGYAAFFDDSIGLNFKEFHAQACLIVGGYMTDEGVESGVFVHDWFIKQQGKLMTEVHRKVVELDRNTTKTDLVDSLVAAYKDQKMSKRYLVLLATNHYYHTYYKPHLDLFLRDVIVRLASYDWEITRNGFPVTVDVINELFVNEHDEDILFQLQEYFNSWVALQKENYTRKMMKNF